LNRTIYRHDEPNQWLRNKGPKHELQKKNQSNSEREVIRKLMEEHGLRYLPSEKKFYKLFKLSRAEFLKQLESKET